MIEVRYGLIEGGRSDAKYKSGTLDIPTTLPELKDAADLGDLHNVMPDYDDLEPLLNTVLAGDIFVGWDVFGEGVFALTATPMVTNDQLELAVYRKFFE